MNHFKVFNLVASSTFTMLCSHHPHPVSNPLIIPEEHSIPGKHSLPIHLSIHALATTNLLSIFMHLIFWIFHIKKNHTIYELCDLLHSTWNSTQCYMPAWIRQGFRKRMDTYICMAESLCCSPETTTTLLIGYIPIQNKKFKV